MNELICMLDSCDLSTHINCLSEHYLTDHNLLMIKPNNYYLASRFSCQSYSEGCVCLYIKSNWECNMIDLSQYCVEKVTDVCAVKIKIGNHLIILLCINRSPRGNFCEIAVQLNLILKYLHKQKLKFIICSDFNVNFLTDFVLLSN